MEEITLENAPPRLRDMFNKGFVAMERDNLPYAIDIFTACVEAEPRFLSARKFLRAAEIKQFKTRKTGMFSSFTGAIHNLPGITVASTQIRSGKAAQALQTLEKLFRTDPLNMTIIKVFADAAEAADMPEAAIQTLALAREHSPTDVALLNRLGALYMRANQTRQGRECYERVCELRPNDGAALKALKDAMAHDSMNKDGWEEAAATGSGYRGLIKNEKEAEILEKEAKAVKATNDIDLLIAENLTRIKKEPQNINYRRALANLYLANKMFAEAIQTLEDALKMAAGRDPQVDNLLSHARIQQFDHEIEQRRKAGDQAGAQSKEQERNAFAFQDIQDRVTRYPNDLVLRFEYGTMLHQRNQINEAIQQFQMAQRTPQFRARSLYYIGVCFAGKKQYDMAADQLEKAAAEYEMMDDNKKAVLYELGKAREAMGDKKKAVECFKQIYQVDIGYRDISAIIEKGYGVPHSST